MPFASLALNPILLENIRKLGYAIPTPIQAKAIPAILEGRDVMGLAQTGTGKTAAFGLPMLQRLMTGPRRQLRALIICPTRELAEQTFKFLADFSAHTNLRGVTIYGGVGMRPQVVALQRGAEIAIACPGRLLDHIGQGTIRLAQIECLVLDEADRMFDMGFLPDIRKILAKLPARRQTLLFSATMPDEVRGLVRDILRDPVILQIAHSRPAASVSHFLYPVLQHLKTPLLLAILERTDRDSVLVFTRTKHRAKNLATRLCQTGHRAACLQGNLSQRQRALALDGFRTGRHQILVATDLAARGIDVSTISHVINFDMPHTVDDYTHRIGRTGRAAKTGDAFTLITAEDEGVVRGVERILGVRIERRRLEGFDYAARPPPMTRAPGASYRPGDHPAGHSRAGPHPRRFGGQSSRQPPDHRRYDGHNERRSYHQSV